MLTTVSMAIWSCAGVQNNTQKHSSMPIIFSWDIFMVSSITVNFEFDKFAVGGGYKDNK